MFVIIKIERCLKFQYVFHIKGIARVFSRFNRTLPVGSPTDTQTNDFCVCTTPVRVRPTKREKETNCVGGYYWLT